jgi:hypothetical protein
VEYRSSREQSSQTTLSAPGRVIGHYDADVIPQLKNRTRGVKSRFCRHLHRGEIFGYSVSGRHMVSQETEWERMLRSFSLAYGVQRGQAGTPFEVPAYAVARSSRLKRTWGAVS